MKLIRNKWWYLFKNTFAEFNKDNAIKRSASLSFYLIFSFPPLIIIILSVFNIFIGRDPVKAKYFSQINSLVGKASAVKIQEMVKNISPDSSLFITAIVFIIILAGAAGVMLEIQSSVNHIWGIKLKPRQSISHFFKNSLASFFMVGTAGVLLIAGLFVNFLMDILYTSLIGNFPKTTVYLFYTLNVLLIYVFITSLFIIIFKALPNGRIPMKDCIIGSLFSSTLFIIGKIIIGSYLSNAYITSVYGALGSVTILLIWVYYSSIILYVGAEFTKVFTNMSGHKIMLDENCISNAEKNRN
jgi:membrane protein